MCGACVVLLGVWGRHRRGVVFLLGVDVVQGGVGCPVLVMQVGVGGAVYLVGLALVDALAFGCGCDGGVGHYVLLPFLAPGGCLFCRGWVLRIAPRVW